MARSFHAAEPGARPDGSLLDGQRASCASIATENITISLPNDYR